MTKSLIPLVDDSKRLRRTHRDIARDGISPSTGVSPLVALGALLTAVKVAVAGAAILVLLPAAIAAQAAAAAR